MILRKVSRQFVLLEYEALGTNSTTRIERKVYRTLPKYKKYFIDNLRTSLTPHYPKPPHIYDLPKIHKDNVPVWPIVSFRLVR